LGPEVPGNSGIGQSKPSERPNAVVESDNNGVGGREAAVVGWIGYASGLVEAAVDPNFDWELRGGGCVGRGIDVQEQTVVALDVRL